MAFAILIMLILGLATIADVVEAQGEVEELIETIKAHRELLKRILLAQAITNETLAAEISALVNITDEELYSMSYDELLALRDRLKHCFEVASASISAVVGIEVSNAVQSSTIGEAISYARWVALKLNFTAIMQSIEDASEELMRDNVSGVFRNYERYWV